MSKQINALIRLILPDPPCVVEINLNCGQKSKNTALCMKSFAQDLPADCGSVLFVTRLQMRAPGVALSALDVEIQTVMQADQSSANKTTNR